MTAASGKPRGSAAERRDWLLSSAPRTYAHTKSVTMAEGKLLRAHTPRFALNYLPAAAVYVSGPSVCLSVCPSFTFAFCRFFFLVFWKLNGFGGFFFFYFYRVDRDVAKINPYRRVCPVRFAESTDRDVVRIDSFRRMSRGIRWANRRSLPSAFVCNRRAL